MSLAIVPLLIHFELFAPEFCSRLRHVCQWAAGMAVPETAVHEYCGAITGKDDVGASWEISLMQSKSEASPMQVPSQSQLRRRISRANARHQGASFVAGNYVRHDFLRSTLSSRLNTLPATRRASRGGTAFPTCTYCCVRLPTK